MLTTRTKQVDCSKARRDLGHKMMVTSLKAHRRPSSDEDVYRVK
jgi:hypothetical protein